MVTGAFIPSERESGPTATVNWPPATFHPVADQTWKLLRGRVKVTVLLAPGARFTRVNDFNCQGGSPAAAGNARYSWGTATPAREPVLVTVNSPEPRRPRPGR